jgi:CRP-like cAMP-binding protein
MKNRLLESLSAKDKALIAPRLTEIALERGAVLFEPGEDVVNVYFPLQGMIGALVLDLKGGVSAEAAMIGQEGAIGGIISEGDKPAFARAAAQIGGKALRISTDHLDDAKSKSPRLRDQFARYADCLLAQVLQSVACNAVHDFDARLARWLLTIHDRLGDDELHVTQEFISQMLGVQRPYTTRVIGELEKTGAIEGRRGVIRIVNRRKLEGRACECYAYLRRHFERLLPGVYPGSR